MRGIQQLDLLFRHGTVDEQGAKFTASQGLRRQKRRQFGDNLDSERPAAKQQIVVGGVDAEPDSDVLGAFGVAAPP